MVFKRVPGDAIAKNQSSAEVADCAGPAPPASRLFSSIRIPLAGSTSTPFIHTMRPSTSRTGHTRRLRPATRSRSSTSFTLRGPEEWRRRTRSPGLQLRKMAVLPALLAEPAPDSVLSVSDADEKPVSIRSRIPKPVTSPGIVTVYPAAVSFSASSAPPASQSRNSRCVRSARSPSANSNRWPARPKSASVRSASVEEKSIFAPHCSAAKRTSRRCTAGASCAKCATSSARPSSPVRPPPRTGRPCSNICGARRAISPAHHASSSRASSAIRAMCSRRSFRTT